VSLPDPPPIDPTARSLNPPAPNPFAPPGSGGNQTPGPSTPAGPAQHPTPYPTSYPTPLYGYGYPTPSLSPPALRRRWGWWITLGVAVALLGLSGLVWAALSIGQNVGSAVASASNNQPGPMDGSTTGRLSDLGAGECFNADGPLTDTDSSVTNVDCGSVHRYEIFFYFEENDGGNSSTNSAMYVCRREAAGRVTPGLQVIGVPSGAASLNDGFAGVYCVLRAPSTDWSGSHSHAVQAPPSA
jgi:hypothetical protein